MGNGAVKFAVDQVRTLKHTAQDEKFKGMYGLPRTHGLECGQLIENLKENQWPNLI